MSHNPKIYGAVLFGFVVDRASTVLTLLKVGSFGRQYGPWPSIAAALIGPYIIMSFVKLKYQLRDLQTQHLNSNRRNRAR